MTDDILTRIVSDPNIMAGQTCIKGTRIPVKSIIGQVARGRNRAEILADYEQLDDEDITAALQYGAYLAGGYVVDLPHSA
jgi:uncharacterized protein (DUF433 family)